MSIRFNGSGFFQARRLFPVRLHAGAVLAALEKHALAIGLAGLAGVFAVRNLAPVDTILVSLALACAVIGLGSAKTMAWFSKGGDASYGMYVFAWPVQQFAHLLIGSFWLSLVVAFLVTTAIGYGTWHGFEKRAMAYRGRLRAGCTVGGRAAET